MLSRELGFALEIGSCHVCAVLQQLLRLSPNKRLGIGEIDAT